MSQKKEEVIKKEIDVTGKERKWKKDQKKTEEKGEGKKGSRKEEDFIFREHKLFW